MPHLAIVCVDCGCINYFETEEKKSVNFCWSFNFLKYIERLANFYLDSLCHKEVRHRGAGEGKEKKGQK